jgi:hypothetical protein
MPRTVDVTLSAELTDAVVAEIQQLDGVVGIRLQRGVCLRPPGDLATVEITNRGMGRLMAVLDRHGVGTEPGRGFSTSEPMSMVSASAAGPVADDAGEFTWEEMETALAKESNMTPDALLLTGAAGFVAALGIGTETLHYVIGAMLIAPGFEPLVRMGLGMVSGSPCLRRGLMCTLQGYAALVAGAGGATALLGPDALAPDPGPATYLPSADLVEYWSNPTTMSVMTSGVASIAGAVVIASGRPLLTAGVMVALALIPSAALTGMALIRGEWGLAGSASIRWAIDAALVVGVSLPVFACKRSAVHHRPAMI